ncbi:Metallothionein expression activator [Fusarium irregulare]|uniref:pH-response transcription factor pacC/RIM101 n=1 Tax=Fusarium irregulare TaxID=2494466 RepID=A0A9W8Q1K9_9HYPO|nr:Metallothionein expression activator [Fusarium irregulare]KAJ4025127.1 Metallothionein expression activator [Fusarium irregulare]
MLSNPSGLHARQKQHRRQNSTPTAFEGIKIPNLPTTQRQSAHRRGLSLDIRRQQSSSTASPTTTTTSSTRQKYMHNVLREAQQQRIQARPGTQNPYANLASSGSENYLMSPHGTPQTQRFDPSCFDPNSLPFDPYTADLNVMMSKGQQAGYGDNLSGGKEFDLFNTNSALSTPTFIEFPSEASSAQGWASEGDTSSTRRTSRRISGGIQDRVNKFENLDSTRPATPPNQNQNQDQSQGQKQNTQSQSFDWTMPLPTTTNQVKGYFPPTPMETPHDRLTKDEPMPSRFAEGYDESMEETIKPVRNRGGNRRAQNIFQEIRQQSEEDMPSQGATDSSAQSSFHGMPMSTPDYMNMNNFNNEFMKIENDFSGQDMHGLDMSHRLPQHSTPDTAQMTQFMGSFDNKPSLRPYPMSAQSISGTPQTPSSRHSAHRRTESVASIASAASIASINIEETKTETGVTQDEIAQFISGPDAGDGKWTCTYEDCGKKFGRKENIKSHVQTHLNDRQYQCPTCKKCFVRQHDLKRHAKIHTGIKPYPCECGNSFARHDALTRHRQRGMCIGAFDNVVRKVVKRGRPPKKTRPDMETRMDKSARTRKKNMSISSMSSFSACSDSSAVNSPDHFMLDDMMDIGMTSQGQNLAAVSSAPMTGLTAAALQEYASSPSTGSVHSYVSPEAIMDGTPMHVASPAKSAASQYNTPPELSQSSSPPATHFFEVEHNNSINTDDLTALPGTTTYVTSATMAATLPLGMSTADDDILLQYATSNSFIQLGRESDMLSMGKIDDYDNGIFDNDVFFGN